MLKLLPLGFALALSYQIASATIVVAVGTKDGILVCEDTRLTRTDQVGNRTYVDSSHKAQRHGSFGFSTAAGALSYSEQDQIAGYLCTRRFQAMTF